MRFGRFGQLHHDLILLVAEVVQQDVTHVFMQVDPLHLVEETIAGMRDVAAATGYEQLAGTLMSGPVRVGVALAFIWVFTGVRK